jgi:hypothetical protein
MAVCLQYQSVYVKRDQAVVSIRAQVAAAVALLLVLGMRVWVKLEATDIGYQVAQQRGRTVSLDMERRELELERAILLRPDTLSSAARRMGGLHDMNSERTLRVVY